MEIGGILYPNSSYILYMEDADVQFYVNAYNYKKRIKVFFIGDYYIRNQNDSLEVTIAAPFESYYEDINETSEVYANDEKIDSSIVFLNGSDLVDWSQYIQDYYNGRYFVLTNLTLAGHSTTNLRYIWSSIIEPQEFDYYVSIRYDVGTGRAWNCTFTERVSMTIAGKKPDRYQGKIAIEYRDDEFVFSQVKKTNFPGFHTYKWEWTDGIIMDDYVFISYDLFSKNYLWEYPNIFPKMITGIAFTGVLVIGTFAIVERAKRKEELRED